MQNQAGARELARPEATRWSSVQKCFLTILKSDSILYSIVNERDFISGTKSHRVERERVKEIISRHDFEDLLNKSLAILQPVDLLIVKYQSDAAPLSEVM
jgi:hypothetical protein